ncbi:YihY/virulence factor BrkB family protein [Streptococcus oricebi]|uniref:YihY/virulence factor BrkB family protein n=1 Tax=Streptococcus oricebi TaxID=1547447 RepID=A0ABS5B2F0_9STRE|nr:YihY/virulence factor BrkB family protein [Streptococcus oricebi]MBP2623010.1 YihY/virulence factor BrkB family protein [Streptococcus oricebi]
MKYYFEKIKTHPFISAFISLYQSAEIEFTSIALAYYLLISIFPVLMILANLLPYLNLDLTDLLGFLKNILPASFYQPISQIVSDVFSRPSTGLLSLSILSALWTFSKSMTLLQKAFNKAYGAEEGRGFIWGRVLSFIISLALQLVLAFSFFLALFGRSLLQVLHRFWSFNQDFYRFLLEQTEPGLYLSLFLSLVMIYYLLPNVRISKLRYVLPGASLVLILFLSLSNLFAIYVSSFMTRLEDFRLLGSVVILAIMVWFIFISKLLIIGAVLNASYQVSCEKGFESRQNNFIKKWKKTRKK